MRYPETLYSIKGATFKTVDLPTMREVRGKEWVYYGQDNLWPLNLIELYDSSAMHHTCIDAIKDGIYGEGIIEWGDTYVNSKGETLNDVFIKVALDYSLYGGYSLNVIWNKEGSGIAEMYHLPFADVRSGKMTDEGNVDEYFYSVDWKNTRKFVPQSYKAFDTTDVKGDNASQIYYVYTYTPGTYTYPLPSYVGALNDIALDAAVSRWHSNNISNGLAPSMFIQFRNGIPSPEERQDIYRDLENTFSGEQNAGRFFLSFSRPGEEAQVTPIENANDDYYIVLDERISSRILTAHRISSPLLLGIKDSSGFSSNADEMVVAYSHFENTVIAPKRKVVIDNMNYIFKLMGYNVKLVVEPNRIVDEAFITKKEVIDNGQDSTTGIGAAL